MGRLPRPIYPAFSAQVQKHPLILSDRSWKFTTRGVQIFKHGLFLLVLLPKPSRSSLHIKASFGRAPRESGA